MNDLTNSFITNNIHAIILILFLFITYWLRNEVGQLVDRLLNIKNLKATLFIIVAMMVFLVSNTFYKFISIETTLVAPYMIAMSALLASIVAVINIINNNIKNIIDKSEKVTALTHSGAVKINFFIEKSGLLKQMLLGKTIVSQEAFIEYNVLLRNILEFINREDLHRYIGGLNARAFYEMHNDIFIFLAILNKAMRDIDKDAEKYDGKFLKVFENIESYEKFIANLDRLVIALNEIKTEETKEYKKLYDEQQER